MLFINNEDNRIIQDILIKVIIVNNHYIDYGKNYTYQYNILFNIHKIKYNYTLWKKKYM